MDRDRLTELAFKTMGKRKSHLQREKGYIFYHCERVAKIAIHLREALFPGDSSKDDVIFAGALFHDVTKGIEPHAATGAYLVPQLLQDYASNEEIQCVSEIVRLHNTRNREDQPFYVRIVQDADILDHFGSQEVWLKFMYGAHKDENVFDAVRMWESDEHEKYVAGSRNALNFELSRQIFNRKHSFHREFVQRFKAECGGQIDY
ncbi:HD domain-containing protein [Paenibacillus allorhizosphaerae]|uniref:HD domain-containing protein n=1 Tax=Paenibacillus allorhizosphaerae TaxID=2849866 RepID=A0ABN7TG41_9BACL|nr:HD domain-containing protein [Paenibacillus allorhizosphaerae]CAG7628275.1 hypothetical protein PAECIP111802_01440 [Paenibacillus allorhizosphaerae]